jgi:hypothetical protein
VSLYRPKISHTTSEYKISGDKILCNGNEMNLKQLKKHLEDLDSYARSACESHNELLLLTKYFEQKLIENKVCF